MLRSPDKSHNFRPGNQPLLKLLFPWLASPHDAAIMCSFNELGRSSTGCLSSKNNYACGHSNHFLKKFLGLFRKLIFFSRLQYRDNWLESRMEWWWAEVERQHFAGRVKASRDSWQRSQHENEYRQQWKHFCYWIKEEDEGVVTPSSQNGDEKIVTNCNREKWKF